MSENVKCAHPACQCVVSTGHEYCSQYCKDAGSTEVEISCDCQHPGCSITEGPRSVPHLD